MKLTLKQLEARCRELNQTLKDKPWGVLVERLTSTPDVSLLLVYRKSGIASTEKLFTGSVRDAWTFLNGFTAGVNKETVDPEMLELLRLAHDRFTDNDMMPPNSKLRKWLDRTQAVFNAIIKGDSK